MKDGGRLAAAITVLAEVLERRQPVKEAMRDWGRAARYAGARDRAFVSGLVLDALRRRNSIAHAMSAHSPRALALGALRWAWNWDLRRIEDVFRHEHAPPPLSAEERECLLLAPDPAPPLHVLGDFPDWMTGHVLRAFADRAATETQAMTRRACVDLRVNTLRTDPDRAARALESVRARPIPELRNGFRIPAPEAFDRSEAVEAIPAYSRGWVEVQDKGSQIAAAVSCVRPGDMALDYCAGGGGKTLAMSAMMENRGQIFAHDVDGRRLSALIPRMNRAGVRNVQLRHPQERSSLEDLAHRMDVVMVDAPCTGSGTWRRKPDAKWRLGEAALRKRCEDQATILRMACNYVRPGGRLVYVTCSFLCEENEDQIAGFLDDRADFSQEDAGQALLRSGALTDIGVREAARWRTSAGALRLTPASADSDGFFVASLRRSA
jgi:16S rRNA (cytosine967-C5)-methyltransferase